MAYHDYFIDNASGSAVRSDLNAALAAIVSNNSSDTEPAKKYKYMWWADTQNEQLKLRNAADDGWVVIAELDGTKLMEDGTAAAPGLAFVDDLDTGLFRAAADQLGIATNGLERVKFGTSEVVFNDGGEDIDFRIEGDTEANLFFVDAGADTVSFRDNVYIDGSGNLLVGTSSAPTNVYPSTTALTPANVFDSDTDQISLMINNDSASGNIVSFASRYTAADNGIISRLIFSQYDGSNYRTAAQIAAEIDGAPLTGSIPGSLVFSVTEVTANAPDEAMRITSQGRLLVGYTTSNGGYKLQVNSQIFATSATIATSDGRYKENVASLGGCLDLVKALRPVSFTWEQQKDITRLDDDGNEVLVREGHNFPEGTQVGFIAQEVQEVMADKPWLGSIIKENVRPAIKDNEGNELASEEQFLGIAEGNLIAVLTNALQEAIAKIETLEAKVAALEAA